MQLTWPVLRFLNYRLNVISKGKFNLNFIPAKIGNRMESDGDKLHRVNLVIGFIL